MTDPAQMTLTAMTKPTKRRRYAAHGDTDGSAPLGHRLYPLFLAFVAEQRGGMFTVPMFVATLPVVLQLDLDRCPNAAGWLATVAQRSGRIARSGDQRSPDPTRRGGRIALWRAAP